MTLLDDLGERGYFGDQGRACQLRTDDGLGRLRRRDDFRQLVEKWAPKRGR